MVNTQQEEEATSVSSGQAHNDKKSPTRTQFFNFSHSPIVLTRTLSFQYHLISDYLKTMLLSSPFKFVNFKSSSDFHHDLILFL